MGVEMAVVMMKGSRVDFCWVGRSCLINCRIAVKGDCGDESGGLKRGVDGVVLGGKKSLRTFGVEFVGRKGG